MPIDFRSFRRKGEKAPAERPQFESLRWWEKETDLDVAHAVTAVLETMKEQQELRWKQLETASRFYGNLPPGGLYGRAYGRMFSKAYPLKERISLNVIQSAVDTIHAKTTKSRPRPMFLTSGGDHKAQRQAKQLTSFINGVFYENKAYVFGADALLDGEKWADGLVHVFKQNKRVRYERTLPHELWVDERDGFYGDPREMHRCKNVNRDVAKQAWPDKVAEIDRADPAKDDFYGSQTTADLVQVRESWHLPSGPDAKDGRHVITVDEAVLFDEPWKHDFFPFARIQWAKGQDGYWGKGLVETLQPLQLEINKLLVSIQRSYHLGGTFKVLLEHGAKVVKDQINNDIGALIYYTGTKPEYITPPLVQGEIYQHLRMLIDSVYEISGVSRLSAQSKKPEGLDSGKAIRAFSDIESERFIQVGRAYEEFYMDLGRLSVEVAKDIAAETGSYKVRVPGKQFLQTIDWKDIDLEDSVYTMQAFPVSSLPSDPSGRLQTVQEMAQAGYLTPRQAKALLDFPDLEAVEGLTGAAEDYLKSILDKIVDDGEEMRVEPYDDLKLARELGLEYYQRGKLNGLEEEKLELLRIFLQSIDEVEEQVAREAAEKQALMNAQAQAAAQAQVAAQNAPPMGAPQAPPVPMQPSPLVPNVPPAPGAP